MKYSAQVGSIVKIGTTTWKVVERNGFTVGIIPHPCASTNPAVQHVDVSMVKKA